VALRRDHPLRYGYGGALLRFRHRGESALADCTQGWDEAFDKLDKVVSQLQ